MTPEPIVPFVFDETELTHEELRALLARAYEASKWNDPGMDVYDEYDQRRIGDAASIR
jgi:hypothetical protein